ncbi:probable 3-deoxy-D-manno-octulosonic acid transferase, mitochondrial isoform X2 [Mangifera indica]|uniref:probable 3-deoxy-D-manno-octulosonic acid transferase, mitochondrial isoform X2 n=1 Tax=Mangifera indica TaxID=29780 RepID=UPI001CF9B7F6|nr:probable 3-deoxy-D-manno-octulosonic acid transferase, mitochondrial isoform X2 [Mangifera indica]
MKGKLLYNIYRTLTYSVSPLVYLHLRWRKIRGLEHPCRWSERLGRPSVARPTGPLLWFHAASLGEGIAAIPVIKHCRRLRPNLTILMTTTTYSAFEVIKNRLPSDIIYQFCPLDIPTAIDAFLAYWKPNAIIIIESELWPNLIMGASKHGIALALLNARVSTKSFIQWSRPLLLPLISLLLSKFSLIVPLSSSQAIRFQLLQAPPSIINFSGDLKYVHEFDDSEEDKESIEELKELLDGRQVWMASSIHRGEEKVMLGVHKVLMEMIPSIVTIIVPRHPQHGKEIAHELQREGQIVALRTRHEMPVPRTNVYVVDTLGELRQFYRLTPIAVIGGSFFPGLSGHNISEAAAAGCAVLTGHHIGHYSNMVSQMHRSDPMSVLQVSGKLELEEALKELFSDARLLEARRVAAKQAFCATSSGIIANVWNLLDYHIFRQALD